MLWRLLINLFIFDSENPCLRLCLKSLNSLNLLFFKKRVIFGFYSLSIFVKYSLDLTVYSCHVTYTFQSESALYSCLNVKELLARSRPEIWRLSYCNWARTQNHLVRKRTLWSSLAKWLIVRLQTKWSWVRV